MASFEATEKSFSNVRGGLFGKSLRNFLYSGTGTASISSAVGVPIISSVRSSWSEELDPGKNGFLLISSANITPTDQTSTAAV
jgi:hypothetical protein